MTAAAAAGPRTISVLLEALGRPPFGARSNGLRAVSWVPAFEVRDERIAHEYLFALRDAGIAGCVRHNRPLRSEKRIQIWVDAVAWSAAEDVGRSVLSRAREGALR
jgi:hypothetical protein